MQKKETEIEYCPYCQSNLRGDPIPEETAHNYSGTHWGRKIGIYDTHLDRTVKWKCPDCGKEWNRI